MNSYKTFTISGKINYIWIFKFSFWYYHCVRKFCEENNLNFLKETVFCNVYIYHKYCFQFIAFFNGTVSFIPNIFIHCINLTKSYRLEYHATRKFSTWMKKYPGDESNTYYLDLKRQPAVAIHSDNLFLTASGLLCR